jgi:RHS repeat-associated protein
MAVTTIGTNDVYEWRAQLALQPGAHQLIVNALDWSGFYTASATNTFTNHAADRVLNSYAGNGEVTSRVWISSNGQTNATQSLSWDARDRLHGVTYVDSNTNGYIWSAIYDGWGRRLATTTIFITNGVTASSLPRTISQYFDPNVQFLELGESDSGGTTWKFYGPDLNGVYGGMQGVGGLDAVVNGPRQSSPVVSDIRGNGYAIYNLTQGSLVWYSSRVTAYGAVEGYRPLPLADGAKMAAASAWRGKWADITGLYWIGYRNYIPTDGNWLGADPLGHDADPSLYAFCAGRDPVNSFDPDGRLGKSWVQQSQSIDVNGVGSFLEASFLGAAGSIMQGIGSTPSVFSQAGQGMADARAQINTYSGGDAFLARSLMLPANLAFGTTALINDPVDTVAGMPQGFVNFGAKIGADVYNVGANPSVNSVFDVGEDALGVAALSTGVARGSTATGVTAPLEDLSVQTYLQVTKGAQWQSYFNSFAPGTAQLNVTLGGQTLFRAANSAGAAAFGEFASVEQPSTPAQAIQGNALDPAITGNTAGQLFQVTTRPGFSISGTAAAQGAGYPGGFSQVFQVGRNSIPTWSSVQQIPYSGVTP